VNTAFGAPLSIIGKTGTAEVGGGRKAHSWMITQAPFWLENPDQMPAVTIVAMRENAGEGAYAVGPAIWQMYRDIFRKGYIKAHIPTATNPDLFCPAQNLWQRR
jgi:cell division protein FtsI/penicillin-binding protein 2